ncbi:truncated N-acetylglucosaminidase [Xanthomonas oryzae pv. oryzae MAFF 311018]|nr:truncated N-acetylglucosaminidase [Xanthomonas oryzae pv. oryzae MAFF 311018]
MTASLCSPSSPVRLFAVVLGALLATPVTAMAAPPAQAVVQRLIGARATQFEMRVAPRGDGADWYRIDAGGDTVRIAGSSQVALARGAYAYLGQAGAASMSWEGDRLALPAQWPAYSSGQVRTPFAHRAYLNTCTYGYTTPFWDWPRWQREIDWMALHGIDMPLAMEGQEAIWQALWREFDVSDAALAAYFSGPAFTPWQRMGNIEGYRAPLPQQWIDSKRVLQKQILTRMRELGMQPVLPAFAGYVPKAFAQAHPHARIYRMRASTACVPGKAFTKPIGWIRAIRCLPRSRDGSLSCTLRPTAQASSTWPMPSTKCCRRWPTTAATWPPPSTATASPTSMPHAPRRCRQRNAMPAWPPTGRRCTAPSRR